MKKIISFLFLLIFSFIIVFSQKRINLAEQVAQDQTIIEKINKLNKEKLLAICWDEDSINFSDFIKNVEEEKFLYRELVRFNNLKKKKREKKQVEISNTLARCNVVLEKLEKLRPQVYVIYARYIRKYHN